jgi:hypothetical protein
LNQYDRRPVCSDWVQTFDLRVLHTLCRLCTYNEKLFCFPNHQTIREMVWKFYGRRLSARSMSRHLGALERDGWLRRERRTSKLPSGELDLHSTVYFMTARTVKWAASLGIKLWTKSVKAAKSLIEFAGPLLAEILPRGDQSYFERRAKRQLKNKAPP